jgi:hypothetical protein
LYIAQFYNYAYLSLQVNVFWTHVVYTNYQQYNMLYEE